MRKLAVLFLIAAVAVMLLLTLLFSAAVVNAQWDPIPFPAGASWNVYVACADYEYIPPLVQVRSVLSGVDVAEIEIIEIEIVGNVLSISQPTSIISEGDNILDEILVDVDSSYTFDVILSATGDSKRIKIVAGAAPQCGEEREHIPDMPEIEIDNGDLPAPEGCYKVEIDNQDGGWSTVADRNNPDGIVLHAADGKVELIGTQGQDTNPDHYRLVPTACP
jgi:hypothetical protein